MKKVFFLTTVFAVVVSIFLLSSCSHASSGGGSLYTSHYFKGNIAEAVDYINSLSSVTDTTNYVYFVAIVDSIKTDITSDLRLALNNLSATENTGPYVSLDLTEATALNFIGYFAFQGSSSSSPSYALREVKLPKNCTSIGQYAFSYQAGLQNVVLPESLTSIGNDAFYNCSSLETINLSECTALEEIGNTAFSGCSSLTDLGNGNKLPANLTSLGVFVFYKCEKLATVDLSECTELESIGDYAFSSCSSLETIDLSNCTELKEIGYEAFYSCSSLTEITMTKTDGMAWGYPSSKRTEVSNPSSSNLEMVTDFEEAPVYYLTGNSVEGENPQIALSNGYKYYWYKVKYTETS